MTIARNRVVVRSRPYPWPEQRLAVDGREAVVVRWEGSGDGPPILLLSAAGRALSMWWGLVSAFQQIAREVVAVDLPGTGRAPGDGSPLDLRDADRIVDRIVDELAPAPMVVGNSLGALLAGRLAARRSSDLAGVVMYAPPGPLAVGYRVLAAAACHPSTASALPPSLWREVIGRLGFGGPGQSTSALLRRMGPAAFSQYVHNLTGSLRQCVQPSQWPNPQAITAPSLILFGERDSVVMPRPDHWACRVPGRRHEVVPLGGHVIGRGAAGRCTEALLGWRRR